MPINVGDRIPSVTLKQMTADGVKDVTTDELFRGRKVVVFAVPGAFTPTCSAKHLPGFLEHADAIRAKGVDAIACVSVNDVFVMDAWAKHQGVGDKVMMLADGGATFTKALGLEMEVSDRGVRSRRYAMIVEDGVVKSLSLEAPGAFEVSSAEALLTRL